MYKLPTSSSSRSGRPPQTAGPPPQLAPIQCPAALLCKVCQFPLCNPQVMPCCGLDVCKPCAVEELFKELKRSSSVPLKKLRTVTKKCWSCKAEVRIRDLIDNHSMRTRVDAWKKENPR